MQCSPKLFEGDAQTWITHGEILVRTAIGKAAKRSGWFKRTDRGEVLGQTVAGCLAQVPSTGLAQVVEKLRQWIYGGR
jgi:hypothetical protein